MNSKRMATLLKYRIYVFGFLLFLVTLLWVMFLEGCSVEDLVKINVVEDCVSVEYLGHDVSIVTVDEHEYILFSNNVSAGLCHKVDCKECMRIKLGETYANKTKEK